MAAPMAVTKSSRMIEPVEVTAAGARLPRTGIGLLGQGDSVSVCPLEVRARVG